MIALYTKSIPYFHVDQSLITKFYAGKGQIWEISPATHRGTQIYYGGFDLEIPSMDKFSWETKLNVRKI